MVFSVFDEEVSDTACGLEYTHVEIAVHSVDEFNFEDDVLGDDFFDGFCYTHYRLRLRFALEKSTRPCGLQGLKDPIIFYQS